MQESNVILCLDYLGYSKAKIKKIENIFENLSDIQKDLDKKKELIDSTLGQSAYQNLRENLKEERVDEILAELDKLGINFVTQKDNNFPQKLKEIPDSPVIIYYKGDLSIASNPHILGVVGTRKPSSYGRDICETFVSEVAKSSVVTVSGLAYGIDSIVANTTIKNKGLTIAVLGGGIAKIYPSTNTSLAKDIVETGGLIISEYKPFQNPTQYTFPERNRLISGLSDGVLIIEAGERSGSLITAETALNQGKELFVVPGNLTSVQSKGSNRLIYEIPHSIVIDPKNILNSLGVESCVNKNLTENQVVQLTMAQQLVYDLLRVEDMHFDDLAQKLNMSPRELNILLTDMEILGIIKSQSGNYYGVK